MPRRRRRCLIGKENFLEEPEESFKLVCPRGVLKAMVEAPSKTIPPSTKFSIVVVAELTIASTKGVT